MRNKLFILLVFVSGYSCSLAQGVKIGFQSGYGFYNMQTFKELTKDSYEQVPFKSKIISNYPAYHYYQPMVNYNWQYFEIGLVYLYQTTGSKISSKDFSGEYAFETKITGNGPGILFSTILYKNDFYKFGANFQAGGMFSKLTVTESLQLGDQYQSDGIELKGKSLYLQPGIYFSIRIKRISFEFNMAYQKEILRNNYYLTTDKDFYIEPKEGKQDNWDGFRLGISCWCNLYK